jgi:hypothetical protein
LTHIDGRCRLAEGRTRGGSLPLRALIASIDIDWHPYLHVRSARVTCHFIYPSRSSCLWQPYAQPCSRAAHELLSGAAHDDGVARARLRVLGLHAGARGPRGGVDRDDPALPVRLVGAAPALALEPGLPHPAVLVRPRGTD